ncbi:MAG: hypothetical protein KF709_02725 [Gemmatimonadaceae bacterium]|nr:hypothetical protein [Gemmatimonadaceae bacterium]
MRERPILFSGPMVRAILEGRKTQTRRAVKLPAHIQRDGLLAMTWEARDASLRAQGVSDDARPYLVGPRWEGERLFGNLRGDLGFGTVACPYGEPGDRLWVREKWTAEFVWPDEGGDVFRPRHEMPAAFRSPAACKSVLYAADLVECHPAVNGLAGIPFAEQPSAEDWADVRWAPSIHMPRWASRLTLELTGVRVERVEAISRSDALAEGFAGEPSHTLEGAWLETPEAQFLRTFYDLNQRARRGSNPWVWVIEFARVDVPAQAAA